MECSILGYVLNNCFDYIEYNNLIQYLLQQNAKLFANEIPMLCKLIVRAAGKSDYKLYFDIIELVMDECDISMDNITDDNNDNPIHIIIQDFIEGVYENKSQYLMALSNLCELYPIWMNVYNIDNDTPLLLSIKNEDIDSIFCVCRYMIHYNYNDLIKIINEKDFVELMIDFANNLLQETEQNDKNTIGITILSILLQCFEYNEIFKWKSNNPNEYITLIYRLVKIKNIKL